MPGLSVLGLNHTTAALEVREKLVFDGEQSQRAVGEFRRQFPDGEIVLLSTCNRVEIYTTTPTNGAAVDDKEWAALVSGLWGDWRGVKVAEFSSALYHKTGAEAVGHLFAVAASMDSMVLGETQILGQVRQAYEASRALGAAGGTLHPLFQRAVAVGKEVHGQTALGDCQWRASRWIVRGGFSTRSRTRPCCASGRERCPPCFCSGFRRCSRAS